MIAFENVSKSFWTGKTRKVILDRASFRIDIGNSMGILASNGTGKTTIINMMAGLEKPDEGTIKKTSRVSFPLGFMGGIQGKHTATENARYIARLYGLDPDYVESFCRWLCGLEEYFDMPVGTFSSGMRGRFSFALLLALEFDIYLIDEGMPATSDVEFNRKAGRILRESKLPIEYAGFVEGDDIAKGTVDVVVTEGFTGNIALKTAEGTAKQIAEYLRAAMSRTWMAKLGYILAKGAFDRLREKMDPRKVNGGVFLGLNGIVIKSHGGTDAEGFAAALEVGFDMARNGLTQKI